MLKRGKGKKTKQNKTNKKKQTNKQRNKTKQNRSLISKQPNFSADQANYDAVSVFFPTAAHLHFVYLGYITHRFRASAQHALINVTKL